jgi:hypothetical protein
MYFSWKSNYEIMSRGYWCFRLLTTLPAPQIFHLIPHQALIYSTFNYGARTLPPLIFRLLSCLPAPPAVFPLLFPLKHHTCRTVQPTKVLIRSQHLVTLKSIIRFFFSLKIRFSRKLLEVTTPTHTLKTVAVILQSLRIYWY